MRRWKRLGKVCIVHLTLELDEINRRAVATGEEAYPLFELDDANVLFKKYFKAAEAYDIKIIRVKADGKTVDEIVNEIVSNIGGL